ncbi:MULTISPECIES: helix-turn-helix transcriptional regulator [unclassified Pseudofrankia]|uniref:helix-turn-helix transcriptional regulator n=1 Tax=unclassified Pseudofrankia TaxID=2994372 RepID=UPI0008D8D8B8|nr:MULTISPECIES: helix-turn-helix transcriptional regulator [unclassified Pseudofrankia]MDT3445298.1 helix-turn-helix transcriptional regulator [Pseudofrankia sp. BMG5.37]OHV45252.1 transcriptional regulator [Pseudofrankia sp. BMG5.36]
MTTDGPAADQGQSPAAARRAELAVFLRSQRARLRPADVGLPSGHGRRRTPGLRREEVAELASMSLTWYTWLEQGRPIPASDQVVDALGRALRLDPDQHRHLRALADLPMPPVTTPAETATPRLRRLVDAAAPNAASLYDRHYDFIAWNDAYVRLRHDPGSMPPPRRNLLWMMFTDPENRRRMAGWEPAARAVLGQFRAAAGRQPDDPRFTELVSALTDASPEFRQWWASYPVRGFRPATIVINHPMAGRITLDLFQLRPVEHPDLLLVLQVPAGAEDTRRAQAVLAPPARPAGGDGPAADIPA